uniref:GDP-D-glucose phosphorylase 1 n=1 Tax=Bracon brevicornis TaxID=1563983 RepID=A0A6V7IMX7_9HYME
MRQSKVVQRGRVCLQSVDGTNNRIMNTADKKFPIFYFNEKHLNFTTTIDGESAFDRFIIQKWKEAEENNVFRYKLNVVNGKRVEGRYKFFAQMNLDRAHNRRRPENIESMSMPFDGDRFNFTKISNEEIFFDIGNGDGNNVIAANVSPIEFGHCLFLPQRLECLPQIPTEFSLVKITELMLLSKSSYLRATFNSLCAHASVNHLHWHLYYLKYNLFIETADLEQASSILYVIRDYPAPGFCLKLSSFHNDVKSFAVLAFKIVNYLQTHGIPYNVYITRAQSSPNEALYDDLRIYIWPRKKSFGIKDTRGFVPACCEYGGHVSVRNEQFYEEITEADITSELKEAGDNLLDKTLKDLIDVSELLEN